MIKIPFFVMDIWDDIYNNPIRSILSPFYNVYGDWFLAIFFALLGIIIYTHGKNIAAVAGYFLFLGVFGSTIFHPIAALLFGFVSAAAVGSMLYKSYVTKHREF